MLSRDSGWSELALCFINNLNTHTHIHTHARTHTYTLLLSNAQNAEINTILSAFEIHNTCERTRRQEPHPVTVFPVGQFCGRERQVGALSSQLCPPRSAAPGAHQPQPHLRLIRGGLPHPYSEQAEACNARGNPWSSDTSRSHTWKLSETWVAV